jgi:AbiV family abortive infection protein
VYPSISLNELGEGIEKSIENASRFLDDAIFLFEHEKYESSILLSMLSYEESGKALMLMERKTEKNEITKTQWDKKFCSHTIKNVASRRKVWQDAGYTPHFPDWDKTLAKSDQEWKNVFTYVDYDFRNKKWTTPLKSKEFGVRSMKALCINAMSHSKDALETVKKRVKSG